MIDHLFKRWIIGLLSLNSALVINPQVLNYLASKFPGHIQRTINILHHEFNTKIGLKYTGGGFDIMIKSETDAKFTNLIKHLTF